MKRYRHNNSEKVQREEGRQLPVESRSLDIKVSRMKKLKWLKSAGKYYFAAAVAFLTFIIYLSSLRNGFLWWDDNLYVFENSKITSFNLDLFRWSFLNFHASNWHPLTWISHALDYAIWGLDPRGHHLTNNILHSLNTALVVVLVFNVFQLRHTNTSRNCPGPADGNASGTAISVSTAIIIAVTTGLLFGLHPLHVESVAWISERKDLLCAFFFLLSLNAYLKYATAVPSLQSAEEAAGGQRDGKDNGRGRDINTSIFDEKYLLCLLLFVLALLSKPMAVSLPLVLLILDWYPVKRIRSLKTFVIALIEKAPFLALCVVSSVLTIRAQEAGGALSLNENASLSNRLTVAAWSLFAYLRKMILPIDLMPYYPYPNEISISSPRYLVPVILTGLVTVLVFAAAKKNRLWAAAWSYYCVTLIPVLGIVQVGNQSMADRYTYLPSLGPFLLAGLLSGIMVERIAASKRANAALAGCALAGIFVTTGLGYLTSEQIEIWQNDRTLWSYAIQRNPSLALGYLNRGVASEKSGDLDNAIADYTQVIALEPYRHYAVYFNRAHVWYAKGLTEEAIRDYTTVILLAPDFSGAYYNRGLIYFDKKDHNRAMYDFQKACELGEQKGCIALQGYPQNPR